MIYENAYLWVTSGREEEFEEALRQGWRVLASAEGCRSVELFRDVEAPGAYLLRVGWETLEHHLEVFPGTPLAKQFADVVEQFFDREPVLRHFDSTAVAGGVPTT